MFLFVISSRAFPLGSMRPAIRSLSSSLSASKPPITLLGGFLGSGKTTTLKNILENQKGMKIGVVVNDVAEVNIDAALVKDARNADSSGMSVDTVQLSNGCACCSLSSELLDSLHTLSDMAEKSGEPYDHVVIELSGVADPNAVKSTFEGGTDHPVSKLIDLKSTKVVTLVDSSTFGIDWMSWNSAGDRDNWVDPADECAASLKVTELLAEQVESADTIVVNKIDLSDEARTAQAMEVVKSLNPNAKVFQTQYGKTPLEELLSSVKSEAKKTECCSNPTCPSKVEVKAECTADDHSHDHSHSHSHSHSDSDAAGITSFTYKATRPFRMDRLLNVLNTWPVPVKDELDIKAMSKYSSSSVTMLSGDTVDNPFVSILRSKGFCWMAPNSWGGKGDQWRHETAMYWSHAGKHFGITSAGKWWGSLEGKEQVQMFLEDKPEEYERIMRDDWVTDEFGDRRQELVFIGVGYDEQKIRDSLDECLLTDEEMESYRAQLNNFKQTTVDAGVGGASLFSENTGNYN